MLTHKQIFSVMASLVFNDKFPIVQKPVIRSLKEKLVNNSLLLTEDLPMDESGIPYCMYMHILIFDQNIDSVKTLG